MQNELRRRKEATRARNDKLRIEDSLYDDTFRWHVPIKGYRWIDTNEIDHPNGERGPRRSLLTTGVGIGVMTEVRIISPLTLRVPLCFQFAETKPTKEAIIKFANEWGELGEQAEFVFPDDCNGMESKGETLIFWEESIGEVRRAVRLWQAVQDKNQSLLECELRFEEVQERALPCWVYTEPLLNPHENAALPFEYRGFIEDRRFPLPPKRNHSFVAMCFVQSWLNKNLKDRCGPFLVWHTERKDFCLRVLPTSLIGAIWWQFARMVAGETSFRPCKICGKPLEIASGAFRVDREFCSSACRQKDHRAKMSKARELAAVGVSPVKIAKAIGTTKESILNWLTKKK